MLYLLPILLYRFYELICQTKQKKIIKKFIYHVVVDVTLIIFIVTLIDNNFNIFSKLF